MGRNASLQREQFARCFGVNLAKARSAADVSQDELAFRTSTHRTAISQIERGLSLPGLDSAMKFAAALETSLDELLRRNRMAIARDANRQVQNSRFRRK